MRQSTRSQSTLGSLVGFAMLLVSTMVFVAPASHAFEENRAVKTVIKQSAIGAGIGAAAGYVAGEGKILRNAGIGALGGAGTGLIDSSSTLRGRPLVRSAAKGAVIGTAASAVTRRNKLKGAAIGAGAGAGYHFLQKILGD